MYVISTKVTKYQDWSIEPVESFFCVVSFHGERKTVTPPEKCCLFFKFWETLWNVTKCLFPVMGVGILLCGEGGIFKILIVLEVIFRKEWVKKGGIYMGHFVKKIKMKSV